MPAEEALRAAGLETIRFAPKEGLALINGTTSMTAFAALLWVDAWRVLRALLGAVALAIEALQAPSEPYQPWVHESKGHPGQIAVAAHVRGLLAGSGYVTESSSPKLLFAALPAARARPGLGSAGAARAVIEREINSANDNPLIDPETGDSVPRRQFLWRPHRAAAGHLEARFRHRGQLGQCAVRACWWTTNSMAACRPTWCPSRA